MGCDWHRQQEEQMEHDEKTGGPAFPAMEVRTHDTGDIVHNASQGISVRDYFAAHAPITWQDAIEWLDTYGGEVVGPWHPERIMDTLVMLRSEYADAMLKARAV